METLLNGLKNWRTTAFGIVTGLMLILPQLAHLLDDDPSTTADITMIVAGLGMIFGFAVANDAKAQ